MYKKLAGFLVFALVFIAGTVITLADNEDQELDSEQIVTESSTTTEAAISSTSSSAISNDIEDNTTYSAGSLNEVLPEENTYIQNEHQEVTLTQEDGAEDLNVAQSAKDRYSDTFFNPGIRSETEFLVDIEIKKDPESSDIETHVVSGTISHKENNAIVLMMYYVDKDGRYKELYCVDGEAQNILEEVLLFYSKIELELGDNNLRMIAFKKAEWERLELEKNLQISDYQVGVTDLSFMDKVKNTFKAIVQFEKDLVENRQDVE